MVKSLEVDSRRLGSLVHTQRREIKYKKPLGPGKLASCTHSKLLYCSHVISAVTARSTQGIALAVEQLYP